MDLEHRLIKERVAKLDKWAALGVDPYPHRFRRSHALAEINADAEAMVESAAEVTIAGRMMSKRRHGKLGFSDLADESGQLQLFVRKDVVGENAYEFFKLMVTQLNNQDPMKPLDSAEFMSQTAEFSMVDGIKSIERSISQLAVSIRST